MNSPTYNASGVIPSITDNGVSAETSGVWTQQSASNATLSYRSSAECFGLDWWKKITHQIDGCHNDTTVQVKADTYTHNKGTENEETYCMLEVDYPSIHPTSYLRKFSRNCRYGFDNYKFEPDADGTCNVATALPHQKCTHQGNVRPTLTVFRVLYLSILGPCPRPSPRLSPSPRPRPSPRLSPSPRPSPHLSPSLYLMGIATADTSRDPATRHGPARH